MRLLTTSDPPKLHDFAPNQIPPYAILSHTWGAEEVLFKDMEGNTAEAKAGYKKIQYCCDQAVADGCDYVWIDTCCIDKSSSAELSEAINSMWKWYSEAVVCYAYLADVPAKLGNGRNRNIRARNSAFARSRWFTRGWTLQELIAPKEVMFYAEADGNSWVYIGKRSRLSQALSKITRINVGILTGVTVPQSASVANRMSWASERQTTRQEDCAYCLMGIFSVNMPMMYGEGERAFIRLQEEIMKSSEDHSLFAWKDFSATPDSYCGLLATSPKFFAGSGDIFNYRILARRNPYSMTNRGLSIDLPLLEIEDRTYAALNCPMPGDKSQVLWIRLKRLSRTGDQYARVSAGCFYPMAAFATHSAQLIAYLSLHPGMHAERIYVPQSFVIPRAIEANPRLHCQLEVFKWINTSSVENSA